MKTITVFVLLATLLFSSALLAQNKQINGKVNGENGSPLAGVTIQVKGTAVGTFTKSDGTYKLSVPASGKTLVFKLLGMKPKEIPIGTQEEINVTLEEDKIAMEEVVVTAVGLEREKKSLGYAFEEVGGKLIQEARSVNVLNSLNGKVAGVQVNNSSGMPGSSSYIKIRGITSITGENQPLFVIDGIPIDNSQVYSGNPDDGRNNLLEGVSYSNRAIDINPDDIESISILKGPAATALYGLRASSGAIIITTKKAAGGAGERISVNYTSSLAIDEVNKLPELQLKFSQGRNGNFVQPGTNDPLSWGALIDTLRYTGEPNKFDKNGNITGASDPKGVKQVAAYDNLNDFYRQGNNWTQSLSMAGGTDFGNFFLSLSHSNATGIVPNSSFKRSTARFNGEANISSKLKASGAIAYTNSGGTRIQQGSNTSGVMLGLLRTPPTFDNSNGYGGDAYMNKDAYMFPNGSQRTYRGGGGYDNPYWTVMRNPFFDNVERFIGHFQLNYNITDWLDLMYRLGGDVYSDNRKQEFSIGSRNVPGGRVYHHDITNSDVNSDLILTMTQQLTDDINLKFLLGNNLFSSSYHSLFNQGDGLIVPEFYHISNTSGQFIRESKDRLRRSAFYGDLTLDYASMLYLNFSVRNEQSTTLPKENNSFTYGTGNLSWIFTETFKEALKGMPLSFGQIRANYAVVGKDAPLYGTATPFIQSTYSDGWTDGISFPYGGYVGYSMGDVLGNDQLKPESTTSFEIGLNLNFFENLFGIDFTYYNAVSEDQIFLVPIASSSGYWRQFKNAGKLSNKGFEIVFNAQPLKDLNLPVKWDFNFNFSKNENMVDELAPGVDNIFLGGFEGSSIRAVAGKPYGSIFGYGWLRDPNGNIVIEDDPESDDFGFPILDPIEKDFGSAQADWIIGFRNTFTWEGLTLSVLFDIKQGGVIWNGTKGALYYFGTHKDTEIRGTKKVFEGVKGHYDAELQNPDGTTGGYVYNGKNDTEVTLDQDWLAFNNGNGFYGNNTEDFIEDAGWFRLRELSVSYQLPRSIMEYLPFQELIVSFTGRNLWLSTDYTGVDPETNLMGAHNAQGLDYFNMPGTKTYNFSINVKF